MLEALKQLDRNIWIRFTGETVTGIMMFMIAPFLILYYSDRVDSYMQVGIIIATGPIMAVLGSFLGGRLADVYGRKPVMLAAIIGDATVLIGFAFADSFWPLLLLNAMLGLSNSLFHPAAAAMVADVTEKERLNEAFGLLRMGHNIGAAIGPLLGSAILFVDRSLVFFTASAIFIVYGLVVAFMIRETKPELAAGATERTHGEIIDVFKQDKVFLVFLVAGVSIAMGFAAIESMLPVFLRESLPTYTDRQNPFAYMLALNGFLVVTLQFPIAAKLSNRSFGKVMLLGATVFGLGIVLVGVLPAWLYANGTSYGWLVGALLAVFAFYTLGEMIMTPVQQTFIALIAPEDMRGAYNGAASIQWLVGGVAAPLLGSFFLDRDLGNVVLVAVGLSCCASGYVYYRLGRVVARNASRQETVADGRTSST